jgi:hypothetical protein
MGRLTVLEVRGLTMDIVERGDAAVHLFDLIAEGSLARTEGTPPTVGSEWIVETRLEQGIGELAAIDGMIPELRRRGDLAIVSEQVFISSRPIPGLRMGTRLTREEVAAHLNRIADGP